MSIVERAGLTWKTSVFQGPRVISAYTREISQVSEDEFLEGQPLGKQPLCVLEILYIDSHNNYPLEHCWLRFTVTG